MFFWLGIAIALVAGLAGINLFRSWLRDSLGFNTDRSFDIFRVVLLVLGLGIAVEQHLQSERSLQQLERKEHIISSVRGQVILSLQGEWRGGKPLTEPVNLFFGANPIASVDLNASNGEKIELRLFGRGSPRLVAFDKNISQFQFEVETLLSDPVIGRDRRDFVSCGSGKVKVPGLYSHFVTDRRIQIDELQLNLFVSGKPFLTINRQINAVILLENYDNEVDLQWDKANCVMTTKMY